MTCPVCGADAEQITSTIYGMNILCPMCGEYGITGSVLGTEQWQRFQSEERGDALNKAKASARPGARPMITTKLISADIELDEQSGGNVGLGPSRGGLAEVRQS